MAFALALVVLGWAISPDTDGLLGEGPAAAVRP